MGYQLSAMGLLMLASGVVSLLSAAYLWRRRGAVGRTGLAATLVAAAIWSIAYGVELDSETLATRELWGAAKYVGVCGVPLAWLVFALQYTGRERHVSARLCGALAVVPLVALAALAAPATRSLVRSYPPEPLDRYPVIELGPLFWVLFAYLGGVALVATGVIAFALTRLSRLHRRQTWALIGAIALVLLANLSTNVGGVEAFRRVDPTPVALSVAGLVLILGVFRFGFLSLVPVARTTLVETMPDAVLVLDVHNRVVDLNPAAERMLARPVSAALGQRAQELLGGDLPPPAGLGDARRELTLGSVDGDRDFELLVSPLGDRRGTPGGSLLVLRDITERKRVERELEQLAHHDALTGLPNRKLLGDRLEHDLARARRSGAPLAVLFVDLDGFKMVNDSLGHEGGDRLLVAVARRVRACLRAEDTLGRFGGDEFIVILAELGHGRDAAEVTARILRSLSAPTRVDGKQLEVTASVGIAVWPDDGPDARSLVIQADAAMYLAKRRGGNCYAFSSLELARQTTARLELEADLRAALERDELLVEYQPLVWLASGTLAGFEALVRWRHPERGLLLPADFLPVAERSGLSVTIDAWVLGEACRQARAWEGAERAPCVAVNLSPARLGDVQLKATVDAVLATSGLEAGRLSLELSERGAFTGNQALMAVLAGFRELGVAIALDDFGAGRTTLAQLHELPIDVLKIDRSFVERLGPKSDAAVVSAIVGLAHALGLTVVAEGVERRDQLAQLRELGCDLGQGFLLGEPQPGGRLSPWLARDDGRRADARAAATKAAARCPPRS